MKALDGDSGRFGSIRYTNIQGEHAKALLLDPLSGVVTVASANLLDRETSPGLSPINYTFMQFFSIESKLQKSQ